MTSVRTPTICPISKSGENQCNRFDRKNIIPIPTKPLFILDGFESTLATISDLSMDRVQSITVLKDAAATAIYGSKAANGVVVVETKAPEAGQLRLNYTGNLNFTFADLSDYNLMNAEEKLQFELLSGLYQSWGPDGYLGSVEQERKYNMRLQEVRRGVDTYWMNEPLRFCYDTQTQFVSGRWRRSDALWCRGELRKNQGVMKGSDRDVLNGNVRLIYRKGRVAFYQFFECGLYQGRTGERFFLKDSPKPIRITGKRTKTENL